jgi:hypothetical protein
VSGTAATAAGLVVTVGATMSTDIAGTVRAALQDG